MGFMASVKIMRTVLGAATSFDDLGYRDSGERRVSSKASGEFTTSCVAGFGVEGPDGRTADSASPADKYISD